MNLQQMADAAASILKENLLRPTVKPLDWQSPKPSDFERISMRFKPDGWEPDIEANYILPAACALARVAEKLENVQFACPDDAVNPRAKIGSKDNVYVVVSVKDGAITLATSIAEAKCKS